MTQAQGLPVLTKTIQLTVPAFHEGKEYTELTIRRPKVRDRLIADKQCQEEPDKEVRLFALLCGVADEVIQDLDMDDYEEVQKAVLGFRKKISEEQTPKEE
ncbi:phage tail assembly protein [Vibrio cholerae]|uniref:phage tail assembly protein n=1 Tax=Vibrio cholerae TaxID=666 RepID=UPI0011D50939|nr:phage tail assembly protein [Vibrio cholerae]EGR4477780.1 phage tail assembly protein [Vibrio cholerae]TXX83790.1 phage tail assembly protein [Vibrio cholerae]GHY46491.1 mu-like prophage FluMu gp41 family protein [Vibrio cholerae]GIA53992.1 mu-like prophage FluMu gp41 family protein [Vibrio cholerae]